MMTLTALFTGDDALVERRGITGPVKSPPNADSFFKHDTAIWTVHRKTPTGAASGGRHGRVGIMAWAPAPFSAARPRTGRVGLYAYL